MDRITSERYVKTNWKWYKYLPLCDISWKLSQGIHLLLKVLMIRRSLFFGDFFWRSYKMTLTLAGAQIPWASSRGHMYISRIVLSACRIFRWPMRQWSWSINAIWMWKFCSMMNIVIAVNNLWWCSH
jgi:hypothetical protein